MIDPVYEDARTGSAGKPLVGTPGNVLVIGPSGTGVQPVPLQAAGASFAIDPLPVIAPGAVAPIDVDVSAVWTDLDRARDFVAVQSDAFFTYAFDGDPELSWVAIKDATTLTLGVQNQSALATTGADPYTFKALRFQATIP